MNKVDLSAQIQECLNGRRGWISLKKSDKEMKFEDKVQMAKNAGLKVERHGRHGYTAFRST